MELDLGLALSISTRFPTQNACNSGGDDDYNNVKNSACRNIEFRNLMKISGKRSRNNAIEDDDHFFEEENDPKTLSLLVWNGRRPHQDDEEDDEEEERRKAFYDASEQEDEGDEIVGWPPIRTWRKNLICGGGRAQGGHGYIRRVNGGDHQIHHGAPDDNDGNNIRGSIFRNSIFVKVKMEGVAIGRKIDLMQFDSYQSLTNTLLNMFAKYDKDGNVDGSFYVLSYLDKQGNWLLLGDHVPWKTFIESAQRVEIHKSSS